MISLTATRARERWPIQVMFAYLPGIEEHEITRARVHIDYYRNLSELCTLTSQSERINILAISIDGTQVFPRACP